MTRAAATRLALLLALASLGPPAAAAEPAVSGTFEMQFGAAVGVASTGGATRPAASSLTGAHVELSATFDPVTFLVRLDPSLRTPEGGGAASWQAGLTEAYALVRLGPLDASAGVQRLPLETARLSLPYGVEPVGANGQRRGVVGARAQLYLDRVRLRAALLERDGRWGAAASARTDLTAAQLELHAVYLDGWAFGAGASGTTGSTVLYGEAWLLSDPWRGRGALGASGYLGDALWTLEAAYAPFGTPAPGAPASPQLAGEVDAPLANGDTLRVLAAAALAPSVLEPGGRAPAVSASLTWTSGDPEITFELGPAFASGELGTRYALTARVVAATGF